MIGLTRSVLAVSVGFRHACALTTLGGVKCWGGNNRGELGRGWSSGRRTDPGDVIGLTSGVVAVSAGGAQSCALTTAGGVKCWGVNRNTPSDIVGLTGGVAAVSAGGNHTCALTTEGGLKCWGRRYGRSPVDVVGLTSGVAAVSAGGNHTCALTTAGGVKCWEVVLGLRAKPVDVPGLASGVAAVSAGGNHTCALTTAGGIKCWGGNRHGQLGDGTTTDRDTPVDVVGLTSGVAAVSAGGNHTCALTTAGGVKCWGYTIFAQLGGGSTYYAVTPVDNVVFPGNMVASEQQDWKTLAP